MNLVRVALIGVALGLLAIGLPGSEDTPARQAAKRVSLVTSHHPAAVPAPTLEPLPVGEAPHSVNQLEAVSQIEDEEEPAVATEQPWVKDEQPEQEVVEEDVSLVALNRPLSLEPVYLPAEAPLIANRPAKRRVASREMAARLRKSASGEEVTSTEDVQPARVLHQAADLEQAEVKLTEVLSYPSESEVDVARKNAEVPQPTATRFARRNPPPTAPEDYRERSPRGLPGSQR